ncbi:MAG: metallophosphoesterase, partial [Kiloniellaceae bacterium]
AAEVGALGGADADGILKQAPESGNAVEFGFDGESFAPTLGSGSLTPKEASPALGTAGGLGADPVPGDAGLLVFPAAAPEGGYLVTPGVSGALTSYTLVFDLLIPAAEQTGIYGALFQTDTANAGDSEFFMKALTPTTFGIGISGQYDGAAAFDNWQRIAVTVEDNGDGTSTLKKFIGGDKVGEQTVETARFTIDGDNGFLILTDEDGETYSGYLNSFLFAEGAMSDGQIEELGGAAADGILALPPESGSATQFDFDGETLAATFGGGTLTDRSDGSTGGGTALEILNPIKDMLVTPETANMVIDLTTVFAGEGLTYTVENSDGGVLSVAASAAGTLELDFEALGFSDIKVTATDADGNTATDWFRARVAGENAYTIAVLPDTQDYTDNAARIPTFANMTQWLADNAEGKNIQFVMNVGDMTQNNVAAEWAVAQQAYSILDGVIPYAVVPGNHDQGGGAADFSSLISQYFPPEKFAVENGGTLGGVYEGDMSNSWHSFEAPDGTKWLVMSVEFGTRDDVIKWAEGVIEDHLDHRVILANHFYMNFPDRGNPLSGPLYGEGTGHNYGLVRSPEGSSDGEEVWQELLSKYPNITFTFSGHVFGDGAETLVSYTDYGTPLYQMVVNYQNGVAQEIQENGVDGRGGNGGNGAIRLLTIDPDNNTVWTETYFANYDEYLTSYRDKAEYDRDGLTGPYREHQETFENIDVGAPPVYAKAKAGDDQFVEAEAGAANATVALDASASIDPNDEIVSYQWLDSEGRVVAEGETAALDLPGGRHDLTLVTTDVNGVKNSDDIRVVVSTDKTLLLDNFNDGDFEGWADSNQVDETPLDQQLALNTPAGFGIPELPGGDAVVVSFPRSTVNQGYGIKPDFLPESGDAFTQYSMVFDIYFPSQEGNFAAFFQTDVANVTDADAFLRADGGIGISGNYQGNFTFDAWHRVAFTLEDMGDSLTMRKYIDGVKVGEQSVDPARFSIDPEQGFLILTDEDGEVYSGYLNSFLFTADLLSESDIAALGGPDANGILDAAPAGGRALQFDYDTGFEPTFGAGEATIVDLNTDGSRATWKVKGTVGSHPDAEPGDLPLEGAVYEYSDGAAVLVWDDAAALEWSDYVAEVTILSQDDDTVGLLVYYQDADNHYKVTLDVQTNQRQLVKVKDGVETLLAESDQGYPFNDEMELKVAVVGNAIYASLDGQSLFGGPVIDTEDPLTGGTIALLSVGQYQSIFDDVMVNEAAVTADAGIDQQVTDLDGDHVATVMLDAANSFAADGIVSYLWKEGDTVIATGAQAEVVLGTGAHQLTLVVTDAAGETHEDIVKIDVFNKEQVLLSDGFEDGNSNGWTLVDEGELGDAADWSVSGNALTQAADTYSRELAPDSEAGGVWRQYWSPLGDGWHILRKGTYALYDDAAAYDWADYAFETTFQASDAGGLGLLFHYQDPDNYYKLELDSEDRFVQLTVLVDGIEQSLMLTRNGFSLDSAHQLRVEVRDSQIQAWLDGMALFAEPIEERSIASGTVALYSWGTAGVSFDDVLVRELDPVASTPAEEGILAEGTRGADLMEGTAGDDTLFGDRGDDTLEGGAGDDILDGGRDDDLILAGNGFDTVIGDRGDDSIEAGEGDDYVDAGRDDDLVDGGGGDDTILGDRGDDTLEGGEGDDVIDAGRGNDYVDGGDDDDLILGDRGDDTLEGGDGDDVVYGGRDDDYLTGGDGDDLLLGERDDDTLEGGDGDDTLDGGDN